MSPIGDGLNGAAGCPANGGDNEFNIAITNGHG